VRHSFFVIVRFSSQSTRLQPYPHHALSEPSVFLKTSFFCCEITA
jgi:hypothetical protein